MHKRQLRRAWLQARTLWLFPVRLEKNERIDIAYYLAMRQYHQARMVQGLYWTIALSGMALWLALIAVTNSAFFLLPVILWPVCCYFGYHWLLLRMAEYRLTLDQSPILIQEE